VDDVLVVSDGAPLIAAAVLAHNVDSAVPSWTELFELEHLELGFPRRESPGWEEWGRGGHRSFRTHRSRQPGLRCQLLRRSSVGSDDAAVQNARGTVDAKPSVEEIEHYLVTCGAPRPPAEDGHA
jgi:hypothetical protein